MRDGNREAAALRRLEVRRFGSTYEGWKRNNNPRNRWTRSRFGSTYEGWKLVFQLPEFKFSYVLDLPMRDGNLCLNPNIKRRIRWFWIYL